jgi:hypothetical protein
VLEKLANVLVLPPSEIPHPAHLMRLSKVILLHQTIVACMLVALVIVSGYRSITHWPRFELASYLAAGVAIVCLIRMRRRYHLAPDPAEFAFAMVLLAFCIWTGGSPWKGNEGIWNFVILLGGAGVLWLGSRWTGSRCT